MNKKRKVAGKPATNTGLELLMFRKETAPFATQKLLAVASPIRLSRRKLFCYLMRDDFFRVSWTGVQHLTIRLDAGADDNYITVKLVSRGEFAMAVRNQVLIDRNKPTFFITGIGDFVCGTLKISVHKIWPPLVCAKQLSYKWKCCFCCNYGHIQKWI